MIKIFLSSNPQNAREELLKEIGVLETRPLSFSIKEDKWKDFLDANSLLGDEIVLVFDQEEAGDFKKEILQELSKSKNKVFLFSKETVFLNKILEKLKVETVFIKEKKQIQKKETPPVFKITNAISRGDKRQAWIAFLEAKEIEPIESIHGGLVWFFKNLFIFEKSLKEKFAHGLNPYVLNGVKSAVKNIGENRSKYLYSEITFLLTESRSKGIDTGVEIENFILKKIFK